MSEVTRYDLVDISKNGEHWSEIRETKHGNFIHLTDYQAAQAKIKELEAKNEKLRTQVADFENGAEQNEFYLRQHDRIEKLEQANKIMREALGYLNGEHGIAAPAMVKSHQVVIPEAIKQADEILGE